MNATRLVVRRKDGADVAVLRRAADGAVTIVSATSRIRPDIEQWIAHGLAEFVGPDGDRRPRRTSPSSPKLLDRIGELLSRLGFVVQFWAAPHNETAPAGWLLLAQSHPSGPRLGRPRADHVARRFTHKSTYLPSWAGWAIYFPKVVKEKSSSGKRQ